MWPAAPPTSCRPVPVRQGTREGRRGSHPGGTGGDPGLPGRAEHRRPRSRRRLPAPGGNSLSAAVLANRFGERLGVRPSMRTLFDAKSLAELAAVLGPEASPTSAKGEE
ncbi:acyl carrier protein [Haloactinospora alba]|uniref:acyl carrier protein n=1 Tax=Haloactinospora alba TaxID=405555 RepID=UPI00248303A5|nr:acyl carrier protein [Haloactinospora alba]